MKKLVLGALLTAVASSAACTSDTSAVITANWDFTHLADNSVRACPAGFDTAAVIAQPYDPITNEVFGTQVVDLFDCDVGVGTTLPIDGIFLVWVQIQSGASGPVYAKSAQFYVDTLDGDQAIDFEIFDDAGFFYLTWDLEDAVTGAPLTCDQAGVVGDASVETLVTLAGTTSLVVDKFTCEHGFGTTRELLAGTYTVSVDAEVDGAAVGTAPTLTNKVISAPNGLTDLGHIVIPID